jgi:hypothetical protein
MRMIIQFCTVVDEYLNQNKENIVVFHCRTGKGRSCMLAACYLLHSGVCLTAEDAIDMVCRERTPVRLDALVVPSQIRFVYYYSALLQSPAVFEEATYCLRTVRLSSVPRFSSSIVSAGCSPYLSLSVLARATDTTDKWYPKRVFNQLEHTSKKKLRRYVSGVDSHIDFDLTEKSQDGVRVRGDVCLSIFSKEKDEKMCQLYFNTSFVDNENYLCFEKSSVDIACKDSSGYFFDKDFKIEL